MKLYQNMKSFFNKLVFKYWLPEYKKYVLILFYTYCNECDFVASMLYLEGKAWMCDWLFSIKKEYILYIQIFLNAVEATLKFNYVKSVSFTRTSSWEIVFQFQIISNLFINAIKITWPVCTIRFDIIDMLWIHIILSYFYTLHRVY